MAGIQGARSSACECDMQHLLRSRLTLLTTIALTAACSRNGPATPGPAVRLAAGTSDTIIVNDVAPTALLVRALDAGGRSIPAAAIRYERIRGDSIGLTADGMLSCPRRGDIVVRATLAHLSASLFVLCRPVEDVRIPGPVQFVLGDSALSMPRVVPIAAYDAGRRAVVQLAGNVTVLDTNVAAINGTTLSPRTRGITLVGAGVGNREGRTGVHVYQRVASIAALDTLLRVPPHQRLFAVPLRLVPGESRRQHLPPGDWMLSTQAAKPDGARELRVRIENASCQANFLNDPGRFGCHTGSDAAVVVYRPFAAGDTASVTGYLLVRWLFR
jgi:hypothetical protein